jgi:hypothetical protein
MRLANHGMQRTAIAADFRVRPMPKSGVRSVSQRW